MKGTLFLATLTPVFAADTNPPAVQIFVPGFVVRELPVPLSNQNNVEYAPDGRLVAAGYDGRLHLLRDTDGDGVPDTREAALQDWEDPATLAETMFLKRRVDYAGFVLMKPARDVVASVRSRGRATHCSPANRGASFTAPNW